MVESNDPARAWEATTWEGAQRQTLESALAATVEQRLEWLEEALEIAYRSGALQPVREQAG